MSNIIEIKPLTRVEGHGAVRVFMDGSRVDHVELSLIEPPRLFEALLRGKHFQELPDIICRICSLCSTIHRVTALMAIEQAFDISISDVTRLYRQLIILGGHIQSHALHLFCLALPDYFNTTGFADLARVSPDLLKLGLKIKAVGNDIQETIGGRLIHPVNVKIGGMGMNIDTKDLLRLQQSLESVLADTICTVDLFASFDTSAPHLSPPVYLALRGAGPFPFIGDTLYTSSGKSIASFDYRSFLQEDTHIHSYGKHSQCNSETVTVGAVARLNLGLALSPTAEKLFTPLKDRLSNGGIWQNGLAQAIELVLAVECSLENVTALLHTKQVPQRDHSHVQKGQGTAVTEAPRGVLIHSYTFNSRGYCVDADIITPTAINQDAMEKDLFILARHMEGADESEIKLKLEMLVRAYDPCISCAVHMVKL